MSVCSPAVPSAMAPPVRSDRSAALFSVIELLIVMSPVFDALPIRSVFAAPTVYDLALRVQALGREKGGGLPFD